MLNCIYNYITLQMQGHRQTEPEIFGEETNLQKSIFISNIYV